MAQARINENGDLVNSKTGEVIGNIQKGPIRFDSNNADVKKLEDYGVLLPEMPDEEEASSKEVRQSPGGPAPSDFQTVGGAYREQSSHMNSGPSTFRVKKSKYEVTKDSYFVIRFGLLQMEDGRFVPVNEGALEKYSNAEPHWVKFRMWNFDEELKWKSEFLEYSNQMKVQQVNQDKLNERKIRRLMMDWSFGEYDDNLKLLHCDGVLSDESYSLFMGLYPSIASTIIELMNMVLESYQ